MRFSNRAKNAFILFTCISATLTGCGDSSFLLPTAASSYGLGASVDGTTIAEGTPIKDGDIILPIFSSAVQDDPDISLLRVEVQTKDGAIAATPIEYEVTPGTRAYQPPTDATDGAARFLVSSLYDNLPTFTMPEDLPIGPYVLTFEAMSADAVLARKTVTIFWLGDADFSFSSLVAYPPGTIPSTKTPVIPLGVPVLVDAKVTIDEQLDGWISWYSNGKLLKKGRVADGMNRILWTPPRTEGLHTIRAELSPGIKDDGTEEPYAGIFATTTVAVSSDAQVPGLPYKDDTYQTIFRFLGNLSDASGNQLDSISGGSPDFAPLLDSYGLLIGPTKEYKLDGGTVPVEDGRLIPFEATARLATLDAGFIWGMTIPGESGATGAFTMELYTEDSGVTLRVKSKDSVWQLDASTQSRSRYAAGLASIDVIPQTDGVKIELRVDGYPGDVLLVPTPIELSDSGSLAFGGVGTLQDATASQSSSSYGTVSTVTDESQTLTQTAATSSVGTSGQDGTILSSDDQDALTSGDSSTFADLDDVLTTSADGQADTSASVASIDEASSDESLTTAADSAIEYLTENATLPLALTSLVDADTDAAESDVSTNQDVTYTAIVDDFAVRPLSVGAKAAKNSSWDTLQNLSAPKDSLNAPQEALIPEQRYTI